MRAQDVPPGAFVELRGRSWLAEAIEGEAGDIQTQCLSCISDDALGEQIEVLWDAEIGARVLSDDSWGSLGNGSPDAIPRIARRIGARPAHAAARQDLHSQSCRPLSMEFHAAYAAEDV